MAKTSIIAEQDLSRDIYEANSSYRQFYGTMNLAREASEQNYAGSYNDAIAQAYMSGQKNKAAIDQTDYGTEARDKLRSQIDEAVLGAYDTYRSKYAEGVNEANNSINSSIEQVNTDLHTTGQELGSKYAQYQEGAFRWLEDLKQEGFLDQGGQFATYKEYTDWKDNLTSTYGDYDTYLTEYNTLYPKGLDGEGNYIPKLSRKQFESEKMSEGQWRAAWANQQVFKDVFNKDGTINEDALKTAIFSQLDEDGNIVKDASGQPVITNDLNIKGIEMLDKLNALDSEEYGTYSAWLAQNNKELYMWSVQRAMLGNGTNAAAAMANMGADGVYSFMERFGGLSQQETEKLFGEFEYVTERLQMQTEDGRNTHWKVHSSAGGEADPMEISEKNIEELGKSTKVMTDLYQALDIDNALFVATMEDGSQVDLTMSDMITLQFSQALGIEYEDAAKLLETGEFSKIKTDLSNAKNLTGIMGGSLAIAGISAGAAIAATVSATAASWLAVHTGISAIAGLIGAGSTAGGATLLSGAAAVSSGAATTAAGASAVPVVGWVVAGIALLIAAITGGLAISETRKANKQAVEQVNEQEGALRSNFDQWAVQSASVGYEMRRNALGLN